MSQNKFMNTCKHADTTVNIHIDNFQVKYSK